MESENRVTIRCGNIRKTLTHRQVERICPHLLGSTTEVEINTRLFSARKENKSYQLVIAGILKIANGEVLSSSFFKLTPMIYDGLFRLGCKESILNSILHLFPTYSLDGTMFLMKICDWYLGISRKVMTTMHAQLGDIPSDIMSVISKIKHVNPAYVFPYSPRSLHSATLTQTESETFECLPFKSKMMDEKSPGSYTPVVTKETIARFINWKPIHGISESSTASERIQDFTKLAIEDSFPWESKDGKSGCIIAGGLVDAACRRDPSLWVRISSKTDIDIFVYGSTNEDRKKHAMDTLKYFDSQGATFEHFKSVVKVKKEGWPDVQVIVPYAKTRLAVLLNFDHTMVQVGYQNKEFFATPGYCYFTPKGETYITRYNMRLFRMKKILQRGMIPVSDNTGVFLYPTKTFFSSKWKLDIIPMKPNSKMFMVRSINGDQTGHFQKASERSEIQWIESNFEDLKTAFNPESASLVNGMDIYTDGVHDKFPIEKRAIAGNSDIYGMEKCPVLLRNVTLFESEKYVLSAPDDPNVIEVPHVPFPDLSCGRLLTGTMGMCTQGCYREFVGTLFFKDLEPRACMARPEEDVAPKIKTFASDIFKSSIKYEDLHKTATVSAMGQSIEMWEIGPMIEAFDRGHTYKHVDGSLGFVKIRGVACFSPSIFFGTDDLFLNPASVGSHMMFNAVFNITNLRDLFLSEHSHTTDMMFVEPDDIPDVMKIIERSIYTKTPGTPRDFLRLIRRACDTKEMEEKIGKHICPRQHRAPGLPGLMPTARMSRLYLTRK